ncbi:uncharacterized protein RCC_05093 [Ramularia collo-cygni]|uniref:Uncharacterized protein n=1 Tax=Ramularia collo-cygni TaxID=112498 RepID=A0A2D3V3I2_9PEZI|nr:uncharacterized protein RCC_05093 [Ramularia collo-cygni]CZT19247.1 uncharacterized protein RCC_05093 [Ramularia collo-cygni]
MAIEDSPRTPRIPCLPARPSTPPPPRRLLYVGHFYNDRTNATRSIFFNGESPGQPKFTVLGTTFRFDSVLEVEKSGNVNWIPEVQAATAQLRQFAMVAIYINGTTHHKADSKRVSWP